MIRALKSPSFRCELQPERIQVRSQDPDRRRSLCMSRMNVKRVKSQAFTVSRVAIEDQAAPSRAPGSRDTVGPQSVDTDMQVSDAPETSSIHWAPETFEHDDGIQRAVGEGAQWLKDGTVGVVLCERGPLTRYSAGRTWNSR